MAASKRSTTNAKPTLDRDTAEDTMQHALAKLACVRDLLDEIQNQEIDLYSGAIFARATLVEACTEIERTLHRLGILDCDPNRTGTLNGAFVEFARTGVRHG